MNGQCMEVGSGKMQGGWSSETKRLTQIKGLRGLEFEGWRVGSGMYPWDWQIHTGGLCAFCRFSTITFFSKQSLKGNVSTSLEESRLLLYSKERTGEGAACGASRSRGRSTVMLQCCLKEQVWHSACVGPPRG